VCPIADMAAPKRMGAALTYARRYALFTLVGIAGEDDLDAPDLNGGREAKVSPGPDQLIDATRRGRIDGEGAGRSTAARTTKHIPVRTRPILDPGWSAAARQQFLTEIAALGSSEEAASWARKGLEAKNSLTSEDARIIEDAFALRLTGIGESEESEDRPDGRGQEGRGGQEGEGGEGGQDGRDGREGRLESQQGQPLREELQGVRGRGVQERSRRHPQLRTPSGHKRRRPSPRSIDKSVLALREPRRYRDKEHRNFVSL
jgi:hypothetical protein